MLNNLAFLKMWYSCKIKEFLEDERGEVNIVAMVVLIGVAVCLAIIFKDAISSLINSLLNTIEGKAKNTI